MGANRGLKSRFSQRLHFPNFGPNDAATLLASKLGTEYGLEMGADAKAGVRGLMKRVRTTWRPVASPASSLMQSVAVWRGL